MVSMVRLSSLLRLSLYRKIVGLALVILAFCGIIILLSAWQREVLNERGALRLAKTLFLEARQAEQDFFTKRKESFIVKSETHLQALRQTLSAHQDTTISTLQTALTAYKEQLERFFTAVKERGLTQDLGIEGRFRKQVHAVEESTKQSGQMLLLADMYLARRHEKDFINRGSEKYALSTGETVEKFLADLDKTSLSDSTKQILRAQMLAYKAGFDEYVTVSKRINVAEAALDSLSLVIMPQIDALVQDRDAKAERYQALTRIAAIASFVIALVIALFIARRITEPVRMLTRAAQRIATGDTDVRVSISTGDEMQVLAESFNEMLGSLNTSLLEVRKKNEESARAVQIAEQAQQQLKAEQQQLAQSIQRMLLAMQNFAKGDLTTKLPYDADEAMNKLFHGFNDVVFDICRLVLEVINASEEITRASAQIAESTDDIALGMQSQKQRTLDIASAVEQISVSMAARAEYAHTITQESEDSSVAALRGGEAMSKMRSNITRVTSAVRDSAETIQALGQAGENIGEIISVINEIADQTNLLALNAAIEAARAGEQGRGFAVVADEVRKLAERTQQATREISSMIGQIQQRTHNAVGAMNTATHLVTESEHFVHDTATALQQIIEKTQSVANFMQELNATSREQADSSSLIAENINAVSTTTQQSAFKTQAIAEAADNLEALTHKLQGVVSKFTIG
jgi:methyl-accepting chemotaxis protein